VNIKKSPSKVKYLIIAGSNVKIVLLMKIGESLALAAECLIK
jgi:hypothetical protein